MDKRLISISISIAMLFILISCASAASMTFSGINDITTEGGYLYIAKDNLVKIYNIKVPAHPMGVNNFKPGGFIDTIRIG